MYLAKDATEARLKKMPFEPYRVIAFSSHAVPSHKFGLSEPAIVLTPPEKGTELDDGLLTASEIAQLKMNADWVLLLACDTAGTSDATDQAALSGLAKAFIYAGARTLLVSHWPVDSNATVALTTAMFDILATQPTLGRSTALKCAMERVMHDKQHPHYAHPTFWAPFVVIGESGRGAFGESCPHF